MLLEMDRTAVQAAYAAAVADQCSPPSQSADRPENIHEAATSVVEQMEVEGPSEENVRTEISTSSTNVEHDTGKSARDFFPLLKLATTAFHNTSERGTSTRAPRTRQPKRESKKTLNAEASSRIDRGGLLGLEMFVAGFASMVNAVLAEGQERVIKVASFSSQMMRAAFPQQDVLLGDGRPAHIVPEEELLAFVKDPRTTLGRDGLLILVKKLRALVRVIFGTEHDNVLTVRFHHNFGALEWKVGDVH